MLNHTEVINYIIEAKSFINYLEIGTQAGKNFAAINCLQKTGVDPDVNSRATHIMTSDDFFDTSGGFYDLIFIDGLHTKEQVEKDFVNAMNFLSADGIIVIHDTNPEDEKWTLVPRESKQWTGSVYKFICNLEADFKTLPFDYGITIVKKGEYKINDNRPTWESFCNDRNNILNIASVPQVKAWLSNERDINKEILSHLTEGLTVKEVSDKVALSKIAVEKRIWNMKKIAGVKNITQLVAHCLKKEVVN